MSEASFFNKISQVSLNELVDFLGHNQTEIVLKIAGQYIKTNVNTTKGQQNLSLLKFSPYDFSNEPVTCLFSVKEEVYFFTSYLTSTNSDYTIESPEAIFQLQRRSDYRASIPVGHMYVCEVRSINGQTTKIKAEMRDISLGGCQLSINKSPVEFKKDDEVEINLVLNRFEFPSLLMIAKHVKKVEGQSNTLVGASFAELNGATLSELQAMLMYLDRVHRGKTFE